MTSRAAGAKQRTGRTSPPPPKKNWLVSFQNETAILGFLLALTTLAVYWPVSHHPFVNYDDMVYVVDNPHIKSGLDSDTISWAFTTFYQFNWHPLTWLSHAIDVQMFQLEPAGHHDTNLLLHGVNVLLLFWVLRRATGYVGRSAMIAGLFALHPVNVETVAWIAERKNLLSMMFFLLGLGAYRWYASGSLSATASHVAAAGAGELRVGRYVLFTSLFVLGLMCKPQIITFPFILLLWDYWPLRRMMLSQKYISPGAEPGAEPVATSPTRSFLWLVTEKLPLFAICAASAVVTVVAQKSGGAVVSLQNYPLSIRLGNAVVSYLRYVGKAFWPTSLALVYPHPWHPLPWWQVLGASLFLLIVTALVVKDRARGYLLVGWLWFLGTLVPMIGVVQVGNQAMADRYAYLPYVGLFIMVCWSASEWAQRKHVSVVLVRALAVIVLLTLAIATHRQLSFWNDNITLWSHVLDVTTDNYIAHDNLGLSLMEQGQSDDAIRQYQAALAIYPSDPTSNLRLAVYDHQHGRLPQAIERYAQMISLTPDGPGRAELLSNRGLVYLDLRDNLHAQEDFSKAVAMDSRNYRGWLGAGVVAQRSGDLTLAMQDFKRANAAHPTAFAYRLLANALQQTGHPDEARAAAERAKLLTQNDAASDVIPEGLLAH